MKLSFFVAGHPVTQGSKRAFVNKHTGRAALLDDNRAKLVNWRHDIADEARKAWRGRETEKGPVIMRLQFYLPKPKSAPKKRVTYPIGKRSGDLDKLERAVFDAISGVIILDDAQVISCCHSKAWGEPGALIEMESVTP